MEISNLNAIFFRSTNGRYLGASYAIARGSLASVDAQCIYASIKETETWHTTERNSLIDCVHIPLALPLALVLCAAFLVAATGATVYTVLDYGAVGDGRTDDAQAFSRTWARACADAGSPTFYIPSGRTFLLSRTKLEGPCKSNIHFQVGGNIVAPDKLWTKVFTTWLYFHNVNGLNVDGSGQIDGRGPIWWKCKAERKCTSPPDSVGFSGCNDLKVRDIKLKDSPGKHLTVYSSVGVQISDLTITAPGDSPNTDGMLIAKAQHVQVTRCTIGTGDDCVAIGPECLDVNVTHITCGPGHGISIGSLGGDGITSVVDQVRVSSCNIFDALTGVRIKTWQGGSGYAKNILYEHINFTAVKNPIVIDQFYCPAGNCPNKTTTVKLSNVHFVDIHGTSLNQVGISLACSQVAACEGIIMEDIVIKSHRSNQPPTSSYCINARGKSVGRVIPKVPCLS